MLHLDLIQTLAFAGMVLFAGYGACRHVAVFRRYNLPAPVVGGLAAAAVLAVLHFWDVTPLAFDTTLQKPLMSTFFTSIGFRVSVALLRRGGTALIRFLVLCTIVAVVQNIVGIIVAPLLGQPPLFGVLCGSVTLTGGPATGLAFAPQFDAAGIAGSESIAIVAAIFGIVAAGMFGAPISTILIERLPDGALFNSNDGEPSLRREPSGRESATIDQSVETTGDRGLNALHTSVVVLLVAMGIGSWVSSWLTSHVMTLPIYIGGMITAATIRNFDDVTGWLRLPHRTLDQIGDVALSLFLVMALMMIELWKLASLAVPMTVILSVQVILTAALSMWPLFKLMGGDYDAAVTAGGFFGFMTGITANAMANMDAVVNRYGPAPIAYLVVPVVGAFFIDFTNALLIQWCLNFFH